MKYEHLLPEVEPIAHQSDKARIRFIYGDHWIGYGTASQALACLAQLYAFPTRSRMPNLLILGATNNGKTKLVERFCHLHPPIPVTGGSLMTEMFGTIKEIPVLLMQMPPHPDVKRFYTVLLDYLGLQVKASLRTATLEVEALNQLKLKKVKLLIIDEIHNVLSGRRDQQHEFLNILRFLGNDLKIPLVCTGTKDAYLAISSDPQLENRFEPFILPAWEENQEYYSLLSSYSQLLPLRLPSALTEPKTAKLILEKTEGTLGEISQFLAKAAETSILLGRERLDYYFLSTNSFYASPSERRQQMIRGLER